jgi:ribosome-associated protein
MAKMVKKAAAGKKAPARKPAGKPAAKAGAKKAVRSFGAKAFGAKSSRPSKSPKTARGSKEKKFAKARPPRGEPRRPAAKAVTKKIPKRPPGPLKSKALRSAAPVDEVVLAPVPEVEVEEQTDAGRILAVSIARAGHDKKAEDVLVLDVRGLTSYADWFVLMTADSERQASAIADHLDDQMKKQGTSRVGSEGYESGRWILIDYGDVVAHVMSREARGFYDLEGLWADAPRFAFAG